MARLVCLWLFTFTFGADAKAASNATEVPAIPPLHTQFREAFKQQGFEDAEIAQIELSFYKEGIDKSKWPFTSCTQELFQSASNPANDAAGKIAEAINQAGGDVNDPSSVSEEQCKVIRSGLLKIDNEQASSFVQSDAAAWHKADPVLYNIATNAQANAATVQYLTTGVSMTTGSVASNAAAINSLASAAATNVAQLAQLSSTVGTMSQVTAPTVALAGSLGVPVSTVASMSLAGSFVGPLLGVIAIVYASWPEEESDPWLKIESHVAQMITQKFDAARRKRLGDKLRRYVKQFSRCSQAWVADGLVQMNGMSIPRWVIEEAKLLKGQGGNLDVLKTRGKHERTYPAPSCTQQLEAHMSLERDEWFRTEEGKMSGLFMPFANMHTQLLSLLNDHPYDNKMNWGDSLKTTSAEYGAYMLDHLLSAWKAQACRTLRLRHSMRVTTYWKYMFVVLKEVSQPNAGKDCSSKCTGHGWCNYCGGKNTGACCASGSTDGVCKMFDSPFTHSGSQYSSCVHTDCIQSHSAYYGTELQAFKQHDNGQPIFAQECQGLCRSVENAVVFTVHDNGEKCTCLSASGDGKTLKRYTEDNSFSGPTVCPDLEKSLREVEESYKLNDLTTVPMDEVEACEKSEPDSDFPAVEQGQPQWVRSCLKKATKLATQEYNKFYQRFAAFVDMLAWKAGCGTQKEVPWEMSAKLNGFEVVSSAFDGGHFSDCDWSRQEKMDESIMWTFDETRARGWTGTSRVNMEEQSKMTLQYPMPSWLRDLRNVRTCLRKTAAGESVVDTNSGISASIDNVLEDASVSDERMQETNSGDSEYERMLAQLRR